MGDNGSGKTTLVQNIMRLLPPSTGTIFYTFNGLKTKLKITKTTTPELAKKIGFVFQNPNHMLFGNNVWEEVMLGPKNLFKEPNFAVKNAEELLKLGELLKYKDRHPILLSHGEKRRLNLASVLCYDPAVVILDEPFIGQDPENISKILEYLINIILSGKTVIMITHRADIVHRYCTRLLFLKNGEIIIDGEPNHAFKKLTASGEHAYLPLNLASRGVSFSA